jgi:hypothetical protein
MAMSVWLDLTREVLDNAQQLTEQSDVFIRRPIQDPR